MASIMPFPNVAHRRMPHLPNNSKPTQEQQQQQQQQQHTQQHPIDTLQSQGQESTSHQLRLTSAPNSQKLLEDNLDGQPIQGLLASSPLGKIAIQDSDHIPKGEQVSLHGWPTSPVGLLSASVPLSATNLQDSKMIKNALYDAFGCLYHPSAHTKHSMSTTAGALRSGDVTPLMGLSPKASPLLRPNLGPSAPITPLELSDEGSSTGYFALHVPSTPSSPALSETTPGSASGRHGHHHHHHRHPHISSNLSATYTPEDQAEEEPKHIPSISLSRRLSTTDMALDPAEHPVLSSLQALSLSHPPEHYHRHLGHTLGHDIIPIGEPPAMASHNGPASRTNHAAMSDNPQSIRPLGTSLQGPSGSTPFPMDHNERNSITGFGHQGLV